MHPLACVAIEKCGEAAWRQACDHVLAAELSEEGVYAVDPDAWDLLDDVARSIEEAPHADPVVRIEALLDLYDEAPEYTVVRGVPDLLEAIEPRLRGPAWQRIRHHATGEARFASSMLCLISADLFQMDLQEDAWEHLAVECPLSPGLEGIVRCSWTLPLALRTPFFEHLLTLDGWHEVIFRQLEREAKILGEIHGDLSDDRRAAKRLFDRIKTDNPAFKQIRKVWLDPLVE